MICTSRKGILFCFSFSIVNYILACQPFGKFRKASKLSGGVNKTFTSSNIGYVFAYFSKGQKNLFGYNFAISIIIVEFYHQWANPLFLKNNLQWIVQLFILTSHAMVVYFGWGLALSTPLIKSDTFGRYPTFNPSTKWW